MAQLRIDGQRLAQQGLGRRVIAGALLRAAMFWYASSPSVDVENVFGVLTSGAAGRAIRDPSAMTRPDRAGGALRSWIARGLAGL